MKTSNHLIILAFLLMVSPFGQAQFPYEKYVDLNELDIFVELNTTSSRSMNINMENFDDRPVYCVVKFANGPERTRVKRRHIAPGESTFFTNTAQRQILKMIVFIDCEEDQDSAAE